MERVPGPPLLVIRPGRSAAAQGGDEVMYRRIIAHLARRWEIEALELAPVSKLRKLLNLTTLAPPECTGFISAANRARVRARVGERRFAAAMLLHEATFPMLPVLKRAGIPTLLAAHNVHSLIAETDGTRRARALRPLALAFERRFYADPAAWLLAISQADVAALRRNRIRADAVPVAPPGAPPAVPLRAGAGLIAEAVITGTHGWWRKRRDLAGLVANGSLDLPIHAADPLARAMFGARARPLEDTPAFWERGVRFGLVTDTFTGGFKLKSLEYVAKNCIVLSRASIAAEFAGLPHAAEFVRHTPAVADIRRAIATITASADAAMIARFREFKAACLERFAWDRCLAPLDQIIAAMLAE